MANRKMHMIVGAAAGGASACVLARDQEPAHQLVETLGGVLAGTLAGRLPDIIEPPAAAIEEMVVKELRQATADGTLADDVLTRVKTGADARRRELAKERAALPKAIAELATEGQALVRKVQETTGPATHLLDLRLQEVGAELARREQRLAAVEQQLEALDEAVTEAEWVAPVLRDFDALWEVMSPTNRYRLVHALVAEVVVNEATGKAEITLADLGAGVGPGSETAAGPAAAATSKPDAEASRTAEASP